jgi:glycosyltransferase involved in cell wall biosynthesis
VKVLIQTRPGLGGILTGDVTQVRKTAEALEALGVTVRYSDSLEPDPGDADVVHLFSTLQPYYTYLRLRHLKALGVPVVVSTIYWAWEPAEQRTENILRLGWTRYQVSRAVNALRPHLPDRLRYRLQQTDLPFDIQARFYDLEHRMSTDAMRHYIYDTADVLLPNSHIEYDYLQQHFGTRNDYAAVPNAVDPVFATGDADAFARKFGLRDFVLCCAAVQARKNQIRLIKAADALGLPLVLIGPEEARYAARCREAASDRVHFLGQLEGADLRNAYAAARTHALVSFYETPGLASLEAAISDNTIVASDRGSPREYFGEQAFYCDPVDVPSIEAALSRAWEATPDPALKARILRDYNWRKTAEATLEGYRRAIAKAGKRVPAA